MQNLQNYLKYYSLEDYLFGEVNRNFQERHYLIPEEFFAIVFWKRKPAAFQIAPQWNGQPSIEEVTRKIYDKPDGRGKMEILDAITEIGPAIASAILTVCYPEEFTVIDYKALDSLWEIEAKRCSDKKLPKNAEIFTIDDYINYNNICKEVWGNYCRSLRDFDRALWAMYWYKGKKGLVEIAEVYKEKSKGL